MSFLTGQDLQYETQRDTITIRWKQGSFMGIGGDRSQNYILCKYTTSDHRGVPVFIQDSFDRPPILRVDSKLQHGVKEGKIYFVYHDKSQKPFQHLFKVPHNQNDIKFDGKQPDIEYSGYFEGEYLLDL